MLMAVAAGFPSKRRKLAAGNNQNDLSQHHQQHPPPTPLLPGLPDDVALLCLSRLQPSLLFSVCCSWRRLLYSPSFPPFLSLYALLSPQSLSDPSSVSSSSAQFFAFDPISSDWHVLPPPPPEPSLRLLLRHPSFISRNLPIQSVSVSGNLVLLAATTTNLSPALPRPLVFNPLTRKWAFGPQLVYPRRWCAAGSSKGAVYVASGIGSHYSADVARSAERWDLEKKDGSPDDSEANWEMLSGLKDGRFSREAIDAVGWRGKLCMVNVKGNAAKEGVVYDVESDTWEEMPAGMIAGWRGPVAAIDEDSMFVVDEARGALRRFDPEREEWESVTESESLRGAEQMAAGGGRVCVVCRGRIVVVDVTASPARLWAVETPPGLQAVAVHILPRMSKPYVLASTSSSSNSRE